MTKSARDQPVRTFERLLEELQETVRKLDEETLTLEEAVSAYEQSVAIANQCNQMLDEAELRIARIDDNAPGLREQETAYDVRGSRATMLFLGEDEDDLADLLELDE